LAFVSVIPLTVTELFRLTLLGITPSLTFVLALARPAMMAECHSLRAMPS
jgi:hypothetical protein